MRPSLPTPETPTMDRPETLWGAALAGIGLWGWAVLYLVYLAYRVHGGL